MKLAEALRLKSYMNDRLNIIESRIGEYCQIQEGDEPQNDPYELIQEYEILSEQIRILATCINLTNSLTFIEIENNSSVPVNQVENGKVRLTMTEALVTRDNLESRESMYEGLANAATICFTDYAERKYVSMISASEIQKKWFKLSQEIRFLDNKVQQQNWSIILKDLNGDDYVSPISKLLI